jgi:hypothetical protein
MAEDASLRLTPDGQGFFGFNPTHNAYTEIISYDKLVGDSERRNRMFFEKLGLPATAGGSDSGSKK